MNNNQNKNKKDDTFSFFASNKNEKVNLYKPAEMKMPVEKKTEKVSEKQKKKAKILEKEKAKAEKISQKKAEKERKKLEKEALLKQKTENKKKILVKKAEEKNTKELSKKAIGEKNTKPSSVSKNSSEYRQDKSNLLTKENENTFFKNLFKTENSSAEQKNTTENKKVDIQKSPKIPQKENEDNAWHSLFTETKNLSVKNNEDNKPSQLSGFFGNEDVNKSSKKIKNPEKQSSEKSQKSTVSSKNTTKKKEKKSNGTSNKATVENTDISASKTQATSIVPTISSSIFNSNHSEKSEKELIKQAKTEIKLDNAKNKTDKKAIKAEAQKRVKEENKKKKISKKQKPGVVLSKDFKSTAKHSFGRLFAIALTIFLGVGFFAGIRSAQPTMRKSADKQYDRENIADILIYGSLGTTDKDIAAIKDVRGVENAEGFFENDYLCYTGGSDNVVKVMSISSEINLFSLIEGQAPQSNDECIVDRDFLNKTGLKLGDVLVLTTGTDKQTTETLATDQFKITGICTSSRYLNSERGTSALGTGVVDGYIGIPKGAFTSETYTGLAVTVKDAKSLTAFTKEYDKHILTVKKNIEEIKEDRCNVRYAEYREAANKYIDKATVRYNESKDSSLAELAKEYTEVLNAQSAYTTKQTELETAKLTYENARLLLSSNSAERSEQQKKLASAKNDLKGIQAEYNKAQAEVAGISTKLAERYKKIFGLDFKTEEFKGIISEINTLNKELETANEKAASIKATLDKAQALVDQFETTLGLNQTAEEATKIITQFPSRITALELEVSAAKTEYENKNTNYEKSKVELADNLTEDEQVLENTKEQILNVSVPNWSITDRSHYNSYVSFGNDTDAVGVLGILFPLIFFLTAVALITAVMTRTVDEKRREIGILKAMGYHKKEIERNYIKYSLLPTALGAVLGSISGEAVLPYLIVKAYNMNYLNLRYNEISADIIIALISVTGSIAAIILGTHFAVSKTLKMPASSLLRPKGQKKNRHIFLEKITPIWKHLNFKSRAACRNMFRSGGRVWSNIIGIAVCTSLLMSAFGINDSISLVAERQYGQIHKYQAVVNIDQNTSRTQKRTALDKLSQTAGVSEYLQAYRSSIYITSNNGEENTYVMVPQDTEKLKDYISLISENSNSMFDLNDNGILISQKLAQKLKVKVGDEVSFKTGLQSEPTGNVKIAGIVKNYVYDYCYMTPNIYKQLFNISASLNAVLIKTDNSVPDDVLKNQFMSAEGIETVTMQSEGKAQLLKMVTSLRYVIITLAAAAVLLTAVALYALNDLNTTGRKRDIAVLKMLGFSQKQTATFLFRENIFFAFVGIILGLAGGFGLHIAVMKTLETPNIMFGYDLRFFSYLISITVTVIIVVFVNEISKYKIHKTDPIAVLKSPE